MGSKFSLKERIFLMEDKLLPCLQHGFLRSEENDILNNFQYLRSVGVGVSCNFMDTVVNSNYTAMAAVIAIVLYWQMLCLKFLWQILLTPLCCYMFGRWKATVVCIITTCVEQVAGVIANVADEIVTLGGLFYFEFWFV